MVIVNIDKPNKTFTIHETTCTYAGKAAETPFKGFGTLKRDGGWLLFNDRTASVVRHDAEFSDYDIIDHC